MNRKSINLDSKKMKKSEFYKNKKVLWIDHIDVNKILVSKKEPYGTKNALKHVIGYNNNDVIRPLRVRFPQMTGYIKKFAENVTMPFRANNKQLFKNYNKIWEKVKMLLKIDFESKPVYGDDEKYIKTKIKIYADNMITNFHNKKMPKGKAPCKCLLIIMLDSAIKANKKYFSQILFEECKYVQEKIKTENHIDEDLEKKNLIVTLMIKQNLILIMTNNLLKIF